MPAEIVCIADFSLFEEICIFYRISGYNTNKLLTEKRRRCNIVLKTTSSKNNNHKGVIDVKKILACMGWACALLGTVLFYCKQCRKEEYYDITAVTDWRFDD